VRWPPAPTRGWSRPTWSARRSGRADADHEQRQFWKTFDRPLRSILPLHGTTYVDRDDLRTVMRPLWEAAEPMRNQ
jgi:hypothetical protein